MKHGQQASAPSKHQGKPGLPNIPTTCSPVCNQDLGMSAVYTAFSSLLDNSLNFDSGAFQAQVANLGLLYTQQQQQCIDQQQLQLQSLQPAHSLPCGLNTPFPYSTTPPAMNNMNGLKPDLSPQSTSSFLTSGSQHLSLSPSLDSMNLSTLPTYSTTTQNQWPQNRMQSLVNNNNNNTTQNMDLSDGMGGMPGLPLPGQYMSSYSSTPTNNNRTLSSSLPPPVPTPQFPSQSSLLDYAAFQREAQRLLSNLAPLQPVAMQQSTTKPHSLQHKGTGSTNGVGFPNSQSAALSLSKQPLDLASNKCSPSTSGVPANGIVDDAGWWENSSGDSSPIEVQEMRRNAHLFAEQKRRNNIKQGFEELQAIIPACKGGPGKISKATILQKAMDYIGYIIKEKTGLLEEVQILRQEVQQLRMIIGEYQRNEREIKARRLANIMQSGSNEERGGSEGVLGYRQGDSSMDPEEMERLNKENIKFMVFCTVVDKLFETFNAVVSLDDSETFSKSLLQWFEQYCCPEALRETFLTSLQSLSSCVLSEESTQKIRKWGTALSACKDAMVTTLDSSNIPLAKQLSTTIDTVSGYLGAQETNPNTKAINPPNNIVSPNM